MSVWISWAFLCYSGHTTETGCCGYHSDSDLILQWDYSPDITSASSLSFSSSSTLSPHMVHYTAHAGLRLPIVLCSGIPRMYYHAWLGSSVLDSWHLDSSSSCFLCAFSWCRCGAHPRYTLRMTEPQGPNNLPQTLLEWWEKQGMFDKEGAVSRHLQLPASDRRAGNISQRLWNQEACPRPPWHSLEAWALSGNVILRALLD